MSQKLLIRFWPAWSVVAVFFLIAAADILLPPPLHRAENLSPLVVDRHDQWLHGFTNDDGRWRFGANLDEIDPTFVERLVAVEDKRFWRHVGVDAAAVFRAGVSSFRAGQIVSGASTITMQSARLLEPRPRTLRSKLIEMVRAIQLERRLSKREILELYLTLAPYGGNVEGVRAASLLYFDKEPIRLTDAEQALLIALPQAPEARRPDLRQKNAKATRAAILDKLVLAKAITPIKAAEAKEAVLPAGRRELPKRAYHVARELALSENSAIVHATLDSVLQTRAEALVNSFAERFDDDATASVLIVDNATRSVRAAVGSSGLDVPGGWMDLTSAMRSPGSTLKPFIYGLAFEDGFAGAGTLIDDMPRAFGDYTPENFDRTFRGQVRVREALQHSLNLPAVAALNRIGAPRFAAMLKAAGVALKTPTRADKKSGLALALGGAGVTARDIATLYAALGDDGAVKPLVWTTADQDPDDASFQLFSKNTASRISAILADAPSLAGRAPASLSASATRVAFKTGTSYGYRDAWAAGHGAGYTAVGWVGRADGGSRPGETGRKAAAPLLFDLFDMLERDGDENGQTIEHDEEAPLEALAQFGGTRSTASPEIIFPRDGVEVFLSGAERGFSFAARGGSRDYRWYVNGETIPVDELGARHVWHPTVPGFYDVTVVDGEGRKAVSKVRVLASG